MGFAAGIAERVYSWIEDGFAGSIVEYYEENDWMDWGNNCGSMQNVWSHGLYFEIIVWFQKYCFL